MPDIYKNAFVTIAAAATENCLGGMLGERDWVPASRPLKPMVENEDIPGSAFIDFCLDRTLKRNLEQRPLFHRLLNFDRIQASYTCLRHGLFEDRYILPAEAKEHRNEFITSFRGPLLYDANILHSALKFCYKVLADYTNRSLTFPTDKLVAISGVAKVVGTFLGDEYYAGLWRKSLPQSLLWSPYDEEDLPNPGYVATRPSEYRAPTWSWASAESRISNFLCHALLSEPTLATLVDISTEFGGTDQSGQVKSGNLLSGAFSGKLTVVLTFPRGLLSHNSAGIAVPLRIMLIYHIASLIVKVHLLEIHCGA